MATTALQSAMVALLAGRAEPLRPAERKRLIRELLAQGGQAAEVYEAARTAFLREFRALAESTARSFDTLQQDLVAVGHEALEHAIDVWRPRHGVRFSAFARVVMRRRMLVALSGELRRRRIAAAAASDASQEQHAPSPEELASDAEEDATRRDALRAALRRLNTWQRRIMDLLYIEGRTTGEVASIMGLSHEAVRTTHQRALVQLRQRMGVPQ